MTCSLSPKLFVGSGATSAVGEDTGLRLREYCRHTAGTAREHKTSSTEAMVTSAPSPLEPAWAASPATNASASASVRTADANRAARTRILGGLGAG
eukprot:scaffold1473_cov375-Prasinococcus_capsulatus_cf.AAC.14